MKSTWKKWTACLLATLMVLGTVFSGPGVFAWAADKDSASGASVSAAETGRETINFNNDWLYHEGDVKGAEAADYSDEEWLYVNLPHSTIHYTPDNYYQKDLGIFWYRKHFTVPQEMQGKKLYITFEAAMQAAEVWVNGEKIGTHQGGYTSFVFDLTDKVTYGEENVIAVRIDTRPNTAFNPGKTNPDFQYFGGLYRNVYLTATDVLHVTDAVYENKTAGGGVFLTAPAVSKESATVKSQTDVKNEGASTEEATVVTEVIDEDGETVVATATDTASIAAGESHVFTQELVVENPRLWSINTPELYTVRTTVKTGDTVRDSLETTYGIRKVEWKREGCYINDEFVELSGTNLHSETGMLGNAQSNDAIFEEVRRLKEYGFDFIRMSHYPHAPAFYAACDKYGVAVVDCLSGWQQFVNTDSFKNATYREIREMFHANRNYCSIVLWEPSLNESGYNQAWAQEANRISHEEYPTDGDSRIYTGGWKYWTSFDMGVGTPQANVMNDASKNATMPVVVSEYGDWNYGGYTSSTRVTREPAHTKFKGGDEGMLIQCDNAQESVAFNRSFEWGGAYAYWQYADYAGFDTTDLTYCGVVDIYRIPKFSAYFFQSQRDADVDLSEYGIESGPMAFIANTWASDSPNSVRVFSNCDEVELFVDGVSVGKQAPDATMWGPHGDNSHTGYPSSSSGKEISTENLKHPPFTFDLSAYTPGQGTITAVGYIKGEKAAEYVRKAPGAASQVTLEAENDAPLKLDGSTAKLVWVNVEDANGAVVNTASNAVSFTVEGPGMVIGEKTINVLGGQMGIWVRSKRGEGDITLTATSDGLTTAALTIPTEVVEGLPEVPEGGDADEMDYVPPVDPTPADNLFLNKPATASSENKSGTANVEAASYANDGNESTKWCAKVTNTGDSSVGPHWWQVDMGDTYLLKDVEILFEMNTDYKYQIAISNSPDITQADVVVDRSTNTESVQRVTEEINAEGRYVRVYVNCPASNIWPCIFEVKGTGGSTTSNVAQGKTASASKEGSGHPASHAVDGNPDTYWTNAAMGAANWQVDLGGTYQINHVDVDFVWGNGSLMHTFTLQSSTDGKNWTDVQSYSGPDKMASLDVDITARHLRVYNLYAGEGTRDWTEIGEFYAYGKEAAEEKRLDYGAKASASSSAEGSDPAYGNDGDPAKYWTPAADDASPWWSFDAGGLYNMSNVQLSWTNDGSHKYTIDLSTDGETWTTAVDMMAGSEAGTLTADVVSGLARFVRISLPVGSTEGFWINSNGREASKNVKSAAAVADVSAYVGTPFASLSLPEEVDVMLDGDVSTSLPVVWDGAGYKADTIGKQTVNGTLTMLPGVKNSDGVKVSVVVDVKEMPQQTVTMAMTAPEGLVAPGASFDVAHSFSGLEDLVEPIYVMQMSFTYPEGLTCTEVTPNANINGSLTVGIHNDQHKVIVVYDADTDAGLPKDASGLFTAKFTAADDLAEGDYPVEMSEVLILAKSFNEIGGILQNATVHVGKSAPEMADLQVTFNAREAQMSIDGEAQKLPNLIGSYTQKDVPNGTELAFDFAPTAEGRIFRAVTVNSGEPQIIGEDSYTYAFQMDTLNPNVNLAFETVSKATLKAVLDYAQARIDAGDTDDLVPAVKAKFTKAFDAAADTYKEPAATQAEIDKAWSDLMDAIHYLDFQKGDKKKLTDLIEIAETLDEIDYTAESWTAFQEALEAARETAADENAVQNDIDKDYESLYNAMKALIGVADHSILDMVIAAAKAIDLEKYLDGGKDAFTEALEAAESLGADATQKEVDAAAKALSKAMSDLRLKPDRSELEALLKRMQSKDLSAYTPASAAVYTAAMRNLAAVLAKENATDEELAAAGETAELAEKNLQTKPKNNSKGSSGKSSGSNNAYGASGTVLANPVVSAAQSVAEQSSVRSDTTLPFTMTRGSAYCFKMTVLNGSDVMPSFTVGNGNVLKTQFVAKVGNDYYFRVYATGKPGDSTGVYTTLPGQQPQKHCVVTIA